jgi:hypothetical protein
MAAGRTYTPIATQTLSTSAASVTFSSIPSGYTDLIVVVDAYNNTGNGYWLYMQAGNGSIDTGNNYSGTYLFGNGTSAISQRGTSGPSIVGAIDASNFRTHIVQIQNYANTTTYKTWLSRSNASGYTGAFVNLWRSTSAINTIQFSIEASKSFIPGSTFTLYGILAA